MNIVVPPPTPAVAPQSLTGFARSRIHCHGPADAPIVAALSALLAAAIDRACGGPAGACR